MNGYTLKLMHEFKSIPKLPMFEIQEEDEFYTYDIECNSKGLFSYGYNETNKRLKLFIRFEKGCSLDYHIEGLYELCAENSYNYHINRTEP
jgi:hypothetical protein